MKQAYRTRDGREAAIWFVIVFAGIALQVVTMWALYPHEKTLGAWVLPIAAIPFLSVMILAFWVMAKRTKRRIQGIAAALKKEGVELVDNPSDSIRQLLVPHFEGLQDAFDLRYGAASIVWVAYNPTLLIFEHQFFTGSGKHTQQHDHTVIAFAPHPELPPEQQLGYQSAFWAKRLRLGHGRATERRRGSDFEIGDAAFDKVWGLYGTRSTAEVVLTQAARQRLMQSPKGESWFVGNGWVAIGYDQNLNADNLMSMLAHARAVLNSI